MFGQMGVEPKIGENPPKWMVYFMENPIRMDDLGVPLFLETPRFPASFIAQRNETENCNVGNWLTLNMEGPHCITGEQAIVPLPRSRKAL